MAAKSDRSRLVPSPFFVLRTPLLPFDELELLGEQMRSVAAQMGDHPAEAAAADQQVLRQHLAELLERPELREALFVASPSLMRGFEPWRRQPESKKGRRFERALVRYFLRLCTRATPFGLFAGCSAGELGEKTHLRLPERAAYRRHTRLDMDYLFALSEELARSEDLRGELRYWPSSSLYRAGGRLRYAEARLSGKERSYHLVAVEASAALEETLQSARSGATLGQLARGLVAADAIEAGGDGEITAEDAEHFVRELVDAQILVPELAPPVTGPEPIHDLIPRLGALPAGAVAETLNATRQALEDLDAGGLGASPEVYREIARGLEGLPTKPELPRLFQVDMSKPAADLCLSHEVVSELESGIELLHRLSERARLPDELDAFRQAFISRYGEGCEVPLMAALDEEMGVGIEGSGTAGDVAPLLDGLNLASRPTPPRSQWTRREIYLLRRLQEVSVAGREEWVLSDDDLEQLSSHPDDRPPLPDAIEVMATLGAASPEALATGDFNIVLKGATGPSGVRLLGRFCHADPDIERGVRQHLAAEQALAQDALLAEIVHLPAGRTGNVLCRPVLRGWEIPYLGRSGAAREQQIAITDLRVTVAFGEVILRSARLGRRILPRLTSAHNYSRRSLGLYRFLGALQTQGVAGGLAWSWGPLDNAPFRPRVRHGRLVLARAAWRLDKKELGKLEQADPAARFAAVNAWRRRRCIPRYVALLDGDQELVVDFERLFSVETWLDSVKGRSVVELVELLPTPDRLVVRGPEGRFVHELVMSFLKPADSSAPGPILEQAKASDPEIAAARGGVRRSFIPGSEWLYAKLYTGAASADQVLAEVVAPLVRWSMRSNLIDRWFFIRYGDPDWHLRLRLHGQPGPPGLHGSSPGLWREVLPKLEGYARPLLDDGRLWRLQLDTYERELERYGSGEGIELSEQIFHHDSEAVLAMVHMLEGADDGSLRWRLALRGIDDLFEDCGLDLAAKLELSSRLAAGYRSEFDDSKQLRLQLSGRYREQRSGLAQLLDRGADRESELWPGLAALRFRSRRLAPAMARLLRLREQGRLGAGPDGSPLERGDLIGSLAHMYVNRLIRSSHRAHEVVLYDLLTRLYRSQQARAR